MSYFDFKLYTQMLWNLEKEKQEAQENIDQN